MRIISLVPSATEIVVSLGLQSNLVGVSHECDFPENITKLPKVTFSNIKKKKSSSDINENIKEILKKSLSIYEVSALKLKELKPDIIITQSQCSYCAVSINDVRKCLHKWLSKKPKLIDLKGNNLKQVLQDIKNVGIKVGKKERAQQIIKNFKNEIKNIKTLLNNQKREKKVLCVEWLEPFMISGNWIPDLLKILNSQSVNSISGEHTVFSNPKDIKVDTIDIIIFMPCGYDINTTFNEIKNNNFEFKKIFKNKEKYIVDGNRFFNRPGTSIIESLNILSEILYPEIFKPKFKNKWWIKI